MQAAYVFGKAGRSAVQSAYWAQEPVADGSQCSNNFESIDPWRFTAIEQRTRARFGWFGARAGLQHKSQMLHVYLTKNANKHSTRCGECTKNVCTAHPYRVCVDCASTNCFEWASLLIVFWVFSCIFILFALFKHLSHSFSVHFAWHNCQKYAIFSVKNSKIWE